uniref:Uncharacterized protein n=1 Tax=Avena sativa TaxID=4498 RepID=A0ACD5YX16_AVESA
MTNHFPRLQLPSVPVGGRASTRAQQREGTGGMAANTGTPGRRTAQNAAPSTNVVPASARQKTHVVPASNDIPTTNLEPPRASVVATGPSAALAFPRKKIQAIGRNRASPARLFKLDKLLSKEQKDLITEYGWEGMLMVKASEMLVDLSMWLLSCYDPIRSELAIPGRGTIRVDADSFHKVFGLANEGLPVVYEMETEPISFMNGTYNIEDGAAPEWKTWCKLIKDMNGVADLKFLRAYFAAVISCFICPSTKCSISPRCYPSIINLSLTRRTNFCQFAIDQINSEVKKMGVSKKSVCCCLQHLVILYLDSLEVDEPVPSVEDCPIRAAAWDDKLIQAVVHKDTKTNGEFGKLRISTVC